MNLSELFTNNYEYLNTVAKRIVRCKDYRRADDLLNSTYLVLFEKGTKYPEVNEEFVKWFSKCMKNYFKWPNSEFNSMYTCPDISIDTYHEERINDFLVDEDALKEIETLVEDTNEFTKELIQISSNMGKEKTLRYLELIEFKRTLPEPELILFDLYYEKELSTRKIAELYSDSENKMNYQAVNIMINKIKVKLNNYQWK